MWANLILVVFLLLLTFWWSVQGFFNAFLHLVCTIVAGVLAFALWEPITLGLLMNVKPAIAWGTGLLLPFLVTLLVLRTIADKLIGANVYFTDILNKLLGGVCGFFAAVLAAGVCVISLGFLPLAPDPLGYQPYVVMGSGQVQLAEKRLMPDVEGWAGGFFTTLSAGSMSPWLNSEISLAQAVPDVVRQAHIFRLRPDVNASVVAVPDSVVLDNVWVQDMPLATMPLDILNQIDPGYRNADRKLVVAHATFFLESGTYDNDNTLRLAIPTIRLISHETAGRSVEARLHSPIGVIRQDKIRGVLSYYPITGPTYAPYTAAQEEMIGFLFSIPRSAEPEHLMVRRLRLPITDDIVESNVPERFTVAIGELADDITTAEGGSDEALPPQFELTNRLPVEISKNYGTNFQYDGHAIISVDAAQLVRYPDVHNALRDRVMANAISVPGHMAMVRAKINAAKAREVFGEAMLTSTALETPTITDNRGQDWKPIAFVRLTPERDQQIRILRSGIPSIKELPISEMGEDDWLFLYYMVQKPNKIVRYDFGDERGDLNIEINVR